MRTLHCRVKNMRKTIELKPHSSIIALAFYNSGLAYGALGDYQQEINNYTKALEVKPDFTMAYFNRGVSYGSLGNHHQAIKDYTKSIELKPDYANAYNNRGSDYFKLGNYQQAIQDFKIAAKLGNTYSQEALIKMGKKW
ncbi:MAG: tetratricopeptide repeat protein [Nitrospirae bacterium]|nr:MAG: tetratricopeptide repeat protein [Nitrospirota bacterium]